MRRRLGPPPPRRLPDWATGAGIVERHGAVWRREPGPPLALDVEQGQKEHPTRWEGTDAEGRHALVRYQWYLLAVEIDGKFALRAVLPKDWPGTTELSLSNAGLKQLLMLVEPAILLPF